MIMAAGLDPFGRPASGFRRIGYEAAPIAAELAAILDPDPNTAAEPVTLSNSQADAIARLDEAAASCPVKAARSREIRHHRDQSYRFGLGCDVPDDRRWRAIVSRAFARADAVAWCEAEGREDGRYLAEKAKKIAECRELLEKLTFEHRIHDTIYRHRAGQNMPGDWVADLNRAENTLEQYERIASGLAAKLNPRGAPRVIARTHFVLRIAEAYAILTGDAPQFDGGNDDGFYDEHGERQRPENKRWHDLIKAALDVTGLRRDQQVDSILNHVRQNLLIGDVDRIREIADKSPSELWAIEVGGRPGTGLEIDVGLDVVYPPQARDEAYEHPATCFIGSGGMSRS